MQRIVVLSGAGISAESGIQTFRDADGLWEGHDVMEVATPEGWYKNRPLVLDFYNQRRKQLLEVTPNLGHTSLVELEAEYDTWVITQNVDDLHERAGSSQVIHLHGELLKSRSTSDPSLVYECKTAINEGDTCEQGSQLRPHIVWFGEAVPMLEKAAFIISSADVVLIIGTSLQVYPAAGLVGYAPAGCAVYYIDPKPASNWELEQRHALKVIAKGAVEGVPLVVKELLKK